MKRGLITVWHVSVAVALRDFWWAEFWSAVALIGWAFINIMSTDPLPRHSFGPLLHLAPEEAWEDASLVIGVVQIVALTMDNRWVRATAALFASWLIGTIVYTMLLSGHWPPGAVAYYGSNCGLNFMALWKNIYKPHGGSA